MVDGKILVSPTVIKKLIYTKPLQNMKKRKSRV